MATYIRPPGQKRCRDYLNRPVKKKPKSKPKEFPKCDEPLAYQRTIVLVQSVYECEIRRLERTNPDSSELPDLRKKVWHCKRRLGLIPTEELISHYIENEPVK